MQKSITGFIALIFMLCTSAMTFAQVRVTGTVADVNGESLIGVSVQVKGTTTGIATDVDGNYSIQVPNAQSVLSFSYVGYLSQEVTVGNQRVINITMHEDLQTLEEIVVVGYGVQKKETVTGSVAMVKGEELLKSPASNLTHAITGRMPGVVTFQRSGEPGQDNATIRIRGTNTFGYADPLVVIDGIADRGGGMARLDPNEVETISVLKDGAAAIYGARAANGVILITTKKGDSGQTKPTVEYSANFGLERVTSYPTMANAWEYADLRNELAFNAQMTNTDRNPTVNLPFTAEDIQKYKDGSDPWRYPNTDWYAETFKGWTATQKHSATISGGTKDIQYFAVVGYQNQPSNIRNGYGGYEQYNMRINLDANVSEFIKLSAGLLGREERYKRAAQGNVSDMLWLTSRGRPTDPAFWPNGLPGPAQEYGRNPVIAGSSQTGYRHETTYRVQSNLRADITNPWIDGLKLSFTAAYDKALQRNKIWEQPWYLYTWDGVTVDANNIPVLNKTLSAVQTMDPKLTEQMSDETRTTLGAYLTYDKKFGPHGVSALVGTEKNVGNRNYFWGFRRYYLSTAVQTLTAGGDVEKNAEAGGGRDNWDRRTMHYFGRLAYNYAEKYLFEFLWRYDGSYMFPKDKRYGFFPGVLVGYRISEEDFWKSNVPFLEYFKVRGSWSRVGNDQVYFDPNNGTDRYLQEYQYLATYQYGFGYVVGGQDVKSIEVSRFPNTNITWEVQDMVNVGFEMRAVENRLSLEADYFINKRSQVLWRRNASIPQSTGLTLPAENIGKVENKGFDFRIGWTDQIGKDFWYDISISGGYADNKIIFRDEALGSPPYQTVTGKMIDADMYYLYDGAFKDWDEVNNYANRPLYSGVTNDAVVDGVLNSGIKPGDMKIVDYDKNGVIDGDDRVRINRTNIPKWNGGLNAMFQYKNVDFSFLFQGAFDAWTKVYHDAGSIGNWTKYIYDHRWSYNNPSDKYPRVHDRAAFYWDNGNAAGNNTFWMFKTDYVRLKNVELGYNLPRHIVQQSKFIAGARIFVSGQNLLTFTGIDRDPESTSNNATSYPQLKTLNAGFKLTF
ncbi:MAG: TonB-dependent receptor [Tannerella sp.]|jgi:TonB-linked SusC/RagA family outer membrane protein|nr:TonB-dependent receptor [Tannerella sp.]